MLLYFSTSLSLWEKYRYHFHKTFYYLHEQLTQALSESLHASPATHRAAGPRRWGQITNSHVTFSWIPALGVGGWGVVHHRPITSVTACQWGLDRGRVAPRDVHDLENAQPSICPAQRLAGGHGACWDKGVAVVFL